MIILQESLDRLNPSIKVNGISLGGKVRFTYQNHKLTGFLYGVNTNVNITYDIAVKLENSPFYSIVSGITTITPVPTTVQLEDILDNLTETVNSLFDDHQYVSIDIPMHVMDIDSLDFVEIILKLENDLNIEIDHSKLNISDSIITTAEKIFAMVSK